METEYKSHQPIENEKPLAAPHDENLSQKTKTKTSTPAKVSPTRNSPSKAPVNDVDVESAEGIESWQRQMNTLQKEILALKQKQHQILFEMERDRKRVILKVAKDVEQQSYQEDWQRRRALHEGILEKQKEDKLCIHEQRKATEEDKREVRMQKHKDEVESHTIQYAKTLDNSRQQTDLPLHSRDDDKQILERRKEDLDIRRELKRERAEKEKVEISAALKTKRRAEACVQLQQMLQMYESLSKEVALLEKLRGSSLVSG